MTTQIKHLSTHFITFTSTVTLSSRSVLLLLRRFASPVFLNRYAGSQVYLHVGENPQGLGEGIPSKEYLAAVARIPRLQDQGDGMRSFLGVIMSLRRMQECFRFIQKNQEVVCYYEIQYDPNSSWTHSGGKHRMPVVIRALRAVGVPVVAVADFDLLREERPLRDIVDSLEGDWAAIEPPWRLVKVALDSESRPLDGNYVRQEMAKRLETIPDGPLGRQEQDSIRALTRGDSAWDRAKRAGIEAVPHGDARESAQGLIDSLRQLGLFVVEVGELEGFVPSVGQHGTAWVAEVHERDLHKSDEIVRARHFVKDVVTAAIGEWPAREEADSSGFGRTTSR